MKKTQTGKLGETKAADFLRDKDFSILHTNFHSQYGEIDIIAQKNDRIHFVEVKTRKNNNYGTPIESYHQNKQQKIIKTAFIYLNQQQEKRSFQFDFISILLNQEDEISEIFMLENALYES